MQAPSPKGVRNHLPNGTAKSSSGSHPLDPLSAQEIDVARQVVLNSSQIPVVFRSIFTQEPAKASLVKYLEAEHSNDLHNATKPPRQARAQYDVINPDRTRDYLESVVDLDTKTVVLHRIVEKQHQPALTIDEFRAFQDACLRSPLWKDAIDKLQLPEGFEVVIDPCK